MGILAGYRPHVRGPRGLPRATYYGWRRPPAGHAAAHAGVGERRDQLRHPAYAPSGWPGGPRPPRASAWPPSKASSLSCAWPSCWAAAVNSWSGADSGGVPSRSDGWRGGLSAVVCLRSTGFGPV